MKAVEMRRDVGRPNLAYALEPKYRQCFGVSRKPNRNGPSRSRWPSEPGNPNARGVNRTSVTRRSSTEPGENLPPPPAMIP